MKENLFKQTIKFANHFSTVLNMPCTVFDYERKKIFRSADEHMPDLCACCPNKNCSSYSEFSKGCGEAYRWDGLYIFHCPQDMVLVSTSISDEKGTFAGGLVLGPIILGNKEDILAEAEDPDFISVIKKMKESYPNKIQGMAELLAAISANLSNMARGKSGQYFFRQESLLNAMYIEQMKKSDIDDDYTYPIAMEGKLRAAIRNKDKEGSQVILNQMLAYIFTYNKNRIELIKPRITELMVIISRAAVDAGANVNDIFLINDNFSSSIEEFRDLEDLSAWVSGMLQRFISLTFEFEKVKHADIVYKTIEYIKANYYKHITLDEIAEKAYLSKTYLSTLFKKETGYSISEYINSIRIDRARALLVNSSMSIIEIAAACGFEDQSYFTKVFRKVVGITPKKYRESRGNIKKDSVIR